MVATLKKVAVLLTILFAAVILLLTFNESFSRKNKNAREFTSKTAPGAIKQVTIRNIIKDFAIDKTINQPSWWIRLMNRKFDSTPTLTNDDIDHIKIFAFFIGYPRSGHSIVGSLMDAHPHMVIANEFMLFQNWKYFSDKQKEDGKRNPFYKNRNYLFNALYKRSYWDTTDGLRNDTTKNYTLSMGSLWQGKFDKYITVIGDKSGGKTANSYLMSKTTFSRYIEELKATVKIPIKAIHVVRNPYDQISTCTLYTDHIHLPDYMKVAQQDPGAAQKGTTEQRQSKSASITVSKYKAVMTALRVNADNKTFAAARYSGKETLENCANNLAKLASAVTKIIDLVGPTNVIEMHNADLVNAPKAVIGKLCSSLEVLCAPDYLQACADKVFKSVSRTRDMLLWSPEMKAKVKEEIIETYPFFGRYSFESE